MISVEKPLRVLVVEDEVLIALALCLDLKDMGCTVLPPVHDGSTAIEIAEQETPDLILMDICLPGEVDGIEAARSISARQATAICFMSGYNPVDFEEHGTDLAGHNFLSKPVGKKELQGIIAGLVTDGLK